MGRHRAAPSRQSERHRAPRLWADAWWTRAGHRRLTIPPVGFVALPLLNRAGKPTGRGNGWTKARVCSFRNHHGIAVYRGIEWAERGEITLEAAVQIMDVSVMTALRMVRRGVIKGRQLCRGAPWVIKVEDMAAYREQKPSRCSLTSDPTQQRFRFQ